jgi:hypothetical protein
MNTVESMIEEVAEYAAKTIGVLHNGYKVGEQWT